MVQYKGYAPGTVVTRAQAEGREAGERLLARDVSQQRHPAGPGGDRAAADLPDGNGTTSAVPMAWLIPTGNAMGGFDAATKGVIATQNSGWPCNAG